MNKKYFVFSIICVLSSIVHAKFGSILSHAKNMLAKHPDFYKKASVDASACGLEAKVASEMACFYGGQVNFSKYENFINSLERKAFSGKCFRDADSAIMKAIERAEKRGESAENIQCLKDMLDLRRELRAARYDIENASLDAFRYGPF